MAASLMPAASRKGVEALAEKFDVQPQTIYDFRWRHKHRINAVLAEWSNEFSDLYSVRKHQRVAELEYLKRELFARLAEMKEDAATATETMRRVDSEAAEVRVPNREWRATSRDIAKLEHQIAEEMGQLVQHAAALDGSAWQLGLRPGKDTIDHAKFLALLPDEQTVYLGMVPTFQAMFLKLTEAQRERFLEFLETEDTYEAYGYLQDCTAPEHERHRRLAEKRIREEMAAKWMAEHPSESDDEALADAVNPAPVVELESVKDEPVELFRGVTPPPVQGREVLPANSESVA